MNKLLNTLPNTELKIGGYSIDDLFNSVERESSVQKIANSSETLDDWLKEDENSFWKFEHNWVTGLDCENFRATIHYSVLDDIVVSDDDDDFEPTLQMCSASIKSLGHVIGGMHSASERYPAKRLLLYGHRLDRDDEFMSRLDMSLVRMFSEDFQPKFRRIALCGCFESVEGLREVMMGVYRRLTPQNYTAKIEIYLESTVVDDDGKLRTIADLLHSGYIEPTIIGNPAIIEYVFKRLSPLYTARLYTRPFITKDTKLI